MHLTINHVPNEILKNIFYIEFYILTIMETLEASNHVNLETLNSTHRQTLTQHYYS